MSKGRTSWLKCVLPLAILAVVAAGAAAEKVVPKEDVVEVPAIGQGLCVANVFQSNMVLLARRVQEAEAIIAELKPAPEQAQAAAKKKSAADVGKASAGAQP